MKHVFIANPAAGKQDSSQRVWEMAEAFFSKHPEYGIFSFHKTEKPGDATRIARHYAQTGEEICVYSCGGDGTMVEVFNGILGYDNCVLSCLPMGSGNDFIKAFGADSAPHFLNLEELVPGVVHRIDHLRTNGIASLNITTAGFDAEVCVAMNKYRRLPMMNGKLAYVLAVADRFCHSLKNHYTLELDGIPMPPSDQIFAVGANGRFYGGTFMPAPYADITDGLMDIITIPAVSHMQFVKLVGSYTKGTHFDDAYKIHQQFCFYRVKKMRILSPDPIHTNIDGEVLSLNNPTVEIVPGGVKFKLPAAVWDEYEQNRSTLEQKAQKYLRPVPIPPGFEPAG